MHAICEIVMPKVDDIDAAVKQIMAPFCEHDSDDEDFEKSSYQFWDFWVIGGRFAGNKLRHNLGAERIDAFNKLLHDKGVTVSGFTAGKQSLEPSSQIASVDALWRDYFPDSGLDVCPLFAHSNDQYSSKDLLSGDVMEFGKMPADYKCPRLIFAGARFDGSGLEAVHMLQEDFWNGVNYVVSTWDKTFGSGVNEYQKRIENYADTYKASVTPKEDWLVVTVDYHS